MKPGLKARSSKGLGGGRVGRIKKPLTRKERRKQERTARKQRAAMFHSKNNSSVESSTRNGQNARKIKKKLQKSGTTDLGVGRTHAESAKSSEEKASTLGKGRTASQSLAVMREDKEIARLEKLLKMKKKKKLPVTFKEEGLDCIPPAPTNHDYDYVKHSLLL